MLVVTVETPIGKVRVELGEKGVTRLRLPHVGGHDNDRPEGFRGGSGAGTDGERREADRVREQLAQYFRGGRREFSIPLDLRGTDFQVRVWRAVSKIPYGTTASYADAARVVGRPRAVRAVGSAVGANPVPILVPCHRVIGSSGALTGYGGGLEMKRWLLRLEGVAA